jgi:7-cyano-7-deazaguanine synthase in queuosine biosynthesis
VKVNVSTSESKLSQQLGDQNVLLYGRTKNEHLGSIGAAIFEDIRRKSATIHPKAWDFLSIALAVVSADYAGHRKKSPDGWTREFDLSIPVCDCDFWNSQRNQIERLLAYLTTDKWNIEFFFEENIPPTSKKSINYSEDCISLLSGGLDSFIGALDLAASGRKPIVVSQGSRGEAQTQIQFASYIGHGLTHWQFNHNASVIHPETPPSQRSRSLVFYAYGILAASALSRHQAGDRITLFVCENGFISVNPPLTDCRIGSLSTRTTHPVVIALLQEIMNQSGLQISFENPYQFKTKGQMLTGCSDQPSLMRFASETISCGRYKKYSYRHCGRCIPCLVRRAAFKAWGQPDDTRYVFADLSIQTGEFADFDDVKSAVMGILDCADKGILNWCGSIIASDLIRDKRKYFDTTQNGLDELRSFLGGFGLI